jgi:hypothetical protein
MPLHDDRLLGVLHKLQRSPALTIPTRYLQMLVPSFVRTFVRIYEGAPPNERKIRSTSFLDGARGYVCRTLICRAVILMLGRWASFIVCIYHILSQFPWYWREPFRITAPEGHDINKYYQFMQLPLVRLIHSGPPMGL